MREHNDDAERDLVQRAHRADPEPAGLDVAAGLADVLGRASLPQSHRPGDDPAAAVLTDGGERMRRRLVAEEAERRQRALAKEVEAPRAAGETRRAEQADAEATQRRGWLAMGEERPATSEDTDAPLETS